MFFAPLHIMTQILASAPVDSTVGGNQVLPGYSADPSIVEHEGKYYIYATLDPWGGATLGCWESADFAEWRYQVLNWPTKEACTSPKSKGAMVWAPSVVKGRDGRFYMYVSVGSEVWAGSADSPLGPWRNMLGDKPLIEWDYRPGYHMIDAEAFLDDDGQAYLYWGSGLNWENGRCWVVKLASDMHSFVGEPVDVTPANYFEAPFMLKRAGKYYLMYSAGITIKDTYQIHYAIGDSPFGPFAEAANSPLLATDRENQILSPGHHAMFQRDGRYYVLYHRHSIPYDPDFVGRQVCVDEVFFDTEGLMRLTLPAYGGPDFLQAARTRLHEGRVRENVIATASSTRSESTAAAHVLDGNHATLWAASKEDSMPWLQLDLGSVQEVGRQSLVPEYAWKPVRFVLGASLDGRVWTVLADHLDAGLSGSPLDLEAPVKARYLRLSFAAPANGESPGLVEWRVYPQP